MNTNDPEIIARETRAQNIRDCDKETTRVHETYKKGTRVSYASVPGNPDREYGVIIDTATTNLVRVDWDKENAPSWIDARILTVEK